MGQEDVFNFLKKHPKKWFSTLNILDYIPHLSRNTISCNLRRLKKSEGIATKHDEHNAQTRLYSYWPRLKNV